MPEQPPTDASTRWLNILLATTALVSAWLLFQVQPMVAKRILPWFGGGTAVWTTAMLFFQAVLLAGYLYAYMLNRWLTPARQAILHGALLILAAALAIAVGVIPTDLWKPRVGDSPITSILALLAVFVGLPYVTLAATAPLTQLWFARANPGRTPYRLYALSNFGSLAALVSYPLLIEPRLGVLHQGAVWSTLYLAFAALCITSAALSLRATPAPSPSPPPGEPASAGGRATKNAPRKSPAPTTTPAPHTPLQTFFWLALPACASVALLAFTAFLCQDVASIPLLWIAPMVLYLLSFILTFESDRWYRRWFWMPVAAAATFVTINIWGRSGLMSLSMQLASVLTLLFAIAMVCHGELARRRPPAERLTAFYLAIAAGGALGGFLTSIVAPLLLPGDYELPLVILAAWLLAFAALITDRQSPFYDGRNLRWLLGMGVLLVAAIVATVNLALTKEGNVIAHKRNFYGALRVREIFVPGTPIAYRQLANGRISHGAQFIADEGRRIPSQYYGIASGIGRLLGQRSEHPQRVGIVGLGVGTLAAYAEPGDDYRFYEINPQVTELANEYFTFIADARERGAKITIVPGDARLQLEQEPPQNFDLLAIDAFTGDSIPAHLLTREAFAVYLRQIAEPNGVIALHISNHYVNLPAVVHAAARRYDLETRLVFAQSDKTAIGSDSYWMLAFRPTASIAQREIGARAATESDGGAVMPDVLWTDDYNNVAEVLLIH